MERLGERAAAGAGVTVRKLSVGLFAMLALSGCGLPGKISTVFGASLNVTVPIQTSPGNFTVTADDANAAVANAAALQQASATCAVQGLRSRTVDSSASVREGRHYFTLNFQCQ